MIRSGSIPAGPDDDDVWVPWGPDLGYQNLARYIVTSTLGKVGLGINDAYDQRTRRPAELLARIYRQLAEKKVPYENAPWHPGDRQVIRDTRVVDRSAGTCLDLAVLFAAQCKHAGLRPYLVLLSQQSSMQIDHAIVLVDLAVGVQERGAHEPPVTCIPGFQGEEHVYLRTLQCPALRDNGLAVDVTGACRPGGGLGGRDFATACEDGRSQLLSTAIRKAVLVDVTALHGEGYPEYENVLDRARPAISRHLPLRPQFTAYPSRAELLDELAGRSGTVALYGEPGSGKSMLAHRLAAKAQSGCGWFLDAANAGVLSTSLSDREREEAALNLGSLDQPARLAFAEAALARLHEAVGPWVVVLDNADIAPEDLGRLVPEPDASRGQMVIVTTTSPLWRERTGVHFVELSPLQDDEVRATLGDDVPTRGMAGRPLLVDASARFRQETNRNWWSEGAGGAPDRAVDDFWAAARAQIPEHLDIHALYLAAALAWLPPARLPMDRVCAVVVGALATARLTNTDEEAIRKAAKQLDRIGVVDLADEQVSMHRLMRSAVRRDLRHRDAERFARLAGTLTEYLFAATDEVGREILRESGRPIRQVAATSPFTFVIDPGDVTVIADELTALSAPEDSAGTVFGLHALGGLVERQNDAQAAELYERVRNLLDRERHALPTTAGLRLITVNLLRGKTRTVYRDRHASLPAIDGAIAWMERCRDLSSLLPEDPATRRAFRLTASRAEAMFGLLLRKRAGHFHGAERLRGYHEAREVLERSAAERAALMEGVDSPDIDRSRFNLAGLEVAYAQVDHPSACADHLDKAAEHYDTVLRIRKKRYGTQHLDEVACCVNGLALVAYYRALLIPDSVTRQTKRLREAAERVHEAILLRQAKEGTDDRNTAKSLDLSVKIALARLDLYASLSPKPSDQSRETAGDYFAERRKGQFLPPDFPFDTFYDEERLVRYDPIPLVGAGENMRQRINEWISSEPMAALVTAFRDKDDLHAKELHGTPADLRERVGRLYAFSQKKWQNRLAGQERNATSELPITEEQRDAVLAASTALGLHQGPGPRHRDYDHVLLLGGLVRACFNRPGYAAQLLADGQVRTESVIALGGHRPFRAVPENPAEDEFTLATRIGHPELSEEYQALDLGTRLAFNLGDPEQTEGERHDNIGGTWGVRHYRASDGISVRVAAAPSSDPASRRAHTGDTYAFFAEHMTELRPGTRLLLVTTPIYVPSQHFTALHRLALPYGVEVETIGGDPAVADPSLSQTFTPTRYLAEVHTALRALDGLAAAVAGE
ncbi:AAA family ATPase [Streptomyces sp. NPDC102365]|uniref:AAA family ATPase n=1 Tax=Streptomyces sp. NPDC102365 TaxID=3366162 RepID=UPI0038120737